MSQCQIDGEEFVNMGYDAASQAGSYSPVEEMSDEEEYSEPDNVRKETPPLPQCPDVYINFKVDDYVRTLFKPEYVHIPCTFSGKIERQVYFTCFTCEDMYGDALDVCIGCANRCFQEGHDLDKETFQYGPAYCDKGHMDRGYPAMSDDCCQEAPKEEPSEDTEEPSTYEEPPSPVSVTTITYCNIM